MPWISAPLREEVPFFATACAMGYAIETAETASGQNDPTSSTLIPARFFPAGFRPT